MHGRQSFTNGESRSGERVRLYEVAKEIGLPNKELLTKVRSMGIEVKNHMSSMDVEDVARVKQTIEKERIENREVKRISATVIRRRSKAPKKPVAPVPIAASSLPAEGTPQEQDFSVVASGVTRPRRPVEEPVASPAAPGGVVSPPEDTVSPAPFPEEPRETSVVANEPPQADVAVAPAEGIAAASVVSGAVEIPASAGTEEAKPVSTDAPASSPA
ncbi:MAG: translation initiation factor IF-2 N-terminal domain-containing protein, partial [Deltaproteobacteria bacterium]|nr:translation initiation factor IF-2 N-terminal domain-containing protein [Deltaproteobacteria bacterium]